MDIFSGLDLVQQRAHTSPSSPTTSSSSSSSCVGAAHTCVGTCSHGPYGGNRNRVNQKLLQMQKYTHVLMQLSTGSPPGVPYNARMPHACKKVLNSCPIETMHILYIPKGDKIKSACLTPAWVIWSPTRHFQEAAFLLYSAILAIFRKLHFRGGGSKGGL